MNTKTVDVKEIQTHLTELISLVQEGNEIMLAQDNKPLIRLMPVESPRKSSIPTGGKRIAGLGTGTMWMSDDFDDPLPEEFWRDKI